MLKSLQRISGTLFALLLCAGATQAAVKPVSRIVSLDIAGAQSVGRFGGVNYIRTWGVVHGVVNPGEAVVGLDALPKDAAGAYAYTSEFEVIAPEAGLPSPTTVFVEAENRGTPIFLSALNQVRLGGKPSTATYPVGVGNGFLFEHRIAYARVQWQTGIAAGVPDHAQGIGEVITRDFGRLLAGEGDVGRSKGIGAYRHRILGAISQSAWFVDAFIAEGFNADPTGGRAVFDGAVAIDGTGNWVAINQLAQANGFAQYPYVNEGSTALTARRLLKRPRSDPFYVDVANLTDYYRVRASVSRDGLLPKTMRRYDWPGPHAAGSAAAAQRLFAEGASACNGGVAVPLDPISYGPYARAMVLGLVRQIGGEAEGAPALPPSTLFKLGPPPGDAAHFNPLPGAALKTPVRDADGWPLGGVRFPDAEAPVGEPTVNLPPVGLASIGDTCGNLMEWRAFSAGELRQRYGGVEAYLRVYERALDRLIAKGFVLAADKPEMLANAAALYRNPAGY